jgi:hypothetical protein
VTDWEAAYLTGIIDGEGAITLTRMHENEHRRPCISVASTDRELLEYLQDLTKGHISKKRWIDWTVNDQDLEIGYLY